MIESAEMLKKERCEASFTGLVGCRGNFGGVGVRGLGVEINNL